MTSNFCIRFFRTKFVIFNRLSNLRTLFDPLYDEIVTNTSELIQFLGRHFFIELVIPLSIFIVVMLTFLIDWNWIPLSSKERCSGKSLEDIKKNLFE